MQALFLITTKGIPDLKEPQKWSPEFRDFVSKCLDKEPESRPDANELLKVGGRKEGRKEGRKGGRMRGKEWKGKVTHCFVISILS